MKDNQSLGGTFQVLLLVLFIGLKLGNVIAWSWWWVLSPLWTPFATIIIILLIMLVAIGIIKLYSLMFS